MRVTIDTSAVISVLTKEAHRKAIIRATRGVELLAPASVHWEIGNAFSAMLRRGRIDSADAQRAVEAYRNIPLRLIEVDLSAALRIVEATGLYAYDAYILACAGTQRAPVISLDQGLLEAARNIGIPIVEIEA